MITYGRSGSTLTQELLNSLPGYCVRGENGNLTHFMAKMAHMVEWNESFTSRRDLASRRDSSAMSREERVYYQNLLGSTYDPWYGAELADPDDFRLSLFDLFAQKILQVPDDCRVSGFKEIRQWEHPAFFNTHLDILRTSFPNTRFLFQTRNWEDVSRSGWWAKIPPEQVRAKITTANSLFEGYQSANPEACFTIEFERFREGIPFVRKILDFLGEDLPDARINSVLSNRLTH
ncbi:sulfotransferase [Nioella ostreopsis]|uniref:sulfotransferase n=1 Tax=Nioella ostreopsis TaxID=2448479 RepID=UPI0013DF8478|nr:sulfotransferase [Nioella ostreopsis]